MSTQLQPSFELAKKFLSVLDDTEVAFGFRVLPQGQVRLAAKPFRGSLSDCWPSLTNSPHAGIFVQVNQADGQGQRTENINKVRAVFVDLDGAPLTPVQESSLSPHVIIQSSPDKWHAYWLVDKDFPLEKFKFVQQALAAKFDGDSSVCDLPRIMRLPGSVHAKGEPFVADVVHCDSSTPRYTYEEIVTGLNLESTAQQSRVRISSKFDVNESLGDGERTQALTSFIGGLIKSGMKDAMIMSTLLVWNENHRPPLPVAKLESTLTSLRNIDNRKAGRDESVLDKINEKYATVMLGNKCLILDESQEDVRFLKPLDFKTYNNNLPKVDGKPAVTSWLQSPNRRTYQSVVFAPQGSANDGAYNLWQGFSVEPGEGDCGVYLEHLKENVCSGNDEHYQYLLNWMADAVQNPGSLPGVAVVLRGRQGTGKGVFAGEFGALFGKHFKHIQSYDRLLGRFNGHLADASFIFCDEIIWGGNRKDAGPLKTLITEKWRTSEFKGKDAMQVRNYARIVMATNEEWAIPAASDERRFFMLDVGVGRKQDAQYFQGLCAQMRNGGREALLAFLLSRDISNADIRKIPQTNALAEQKALSLQGIDRWFAGCLDKGSVDMSTQWQTEIAKPRLYELYEEWCASVGDRYPKARNAFFRRLKQICSGYTDTRINGATGGREKVIRLDDLPACRRHFESVTGADLGSEE